MNLVEEPLEVVTLHRLHPFAVREARLLAELRVHVPQRVGERQQRVRYELQLVQLLVPLGLVRLLVAGTVPRVRPLGVGRRVVNDAVMTGNEVVVGPGAVVQDFPVFQGTMGCGGWPSG